MTADTIQHIKIEERFTVLLYIYGVYSEIDESYFFLRKLQ